MDSEQDSAKKIEEAMQRVGRVRCGTATSWQIVVRRLGA